MSITYDDLDALALGAAFLGSGGGGDPHAECLLAKELFRTMGSLPLTLVSELGDDDCVLPLGFVGAPLVSGEKLPSGKEWRTVIAEMEKAIGRAISAVVSAEIGGSNAFAGIIVAKEMGLPLIDADTLGRAFPRLEMSSLALFGISPSPCVIADALGSVAVIKASDPKKTEQVARAVATAFGSSVLAGLYVVDGKRAKEALVSGSISQAIAIGKALLLGKERRLSFCCALSSVVQVRSIGRGIVVDIVQSIEDGFLRGAVAVKGDDDLFRLEFQNEFLVVFKGEKALAATPDIISLVEQEQLVPIGCDVLRFGQQVEIVVAAPPAIWKTPEGLSVTGPEQFGYKL